MISTDHCPFWFEGGTDGRTPGKELGIGNFSKIPNGCPGIEDRMMVLYTSGRARWSFLAQPLGGTLLTNPAKLFGMYPQKGDDRARQRRRHRGVGPQQNPHHQRRDPAPAHRL